MYSWFTLFRLDKKYLVCLVLLCSAPNVLFGEATKTSKNKPAFDYFSISTFVAIIGNSPTNKVEAVKLQTKDPYKMPKKYWLNRLEITQNHLCGVQIDNAAGDYRLATFKSKSELEQEDYLITHYGACGTCSSMQDLQVYLNRPNLTSPVRKCSALSFRWPIMKCLQRLGFSDKCAETWYYNIVETRKKCSRTCVWSWWKNESFNNPDGELNACLRCDEEESGPAFKVTAGRTRRRSGIVSAIQRKAQEFFELSHNYLDKLTKQDH